MSNIYGTLLSSVTVGAGGATSITFTSIPQTMTDLVLVCSLRDTNSGTTDTGIFLRFSGSTVGFSTKILGGNGSAAASANGAVSSMLYNNGYGGDPNAGTTANTFGNVIVTIPNYAGSTNKSVSLDAVGETNAADARQSIVAGLWSNTAAVTSIALLPAVSFAQYSTAYLYGLTKGSGGATVS